MFRDFPYPKQKIIRFTDRVELCGSFDGDTWVVVLEMPLYEAELDSKPRAVFFKIASDLASVAGIAKQPNAETLQVLSQSIMTFAECASSETVKAVLDHIVLYLSEYIMKSILDITSETIGGSQGE